MLTDLPCVALREADFSSLQTKRKTVQQSESPIAEVVISWNNELPVTGGTYSHLAGIQHRTETGLDSLTSCHLLILE